MTTQHTFSILQKQFDLQDSDFYFLDLIPLIAVMWADGMNQDNELKLLYQFVIEHIAHLDQINGGAVISTADANHFLDRFAHRRPDPELLQALLTLSIHRQQNNPARQYTILEYCLDIAAACITHYPYALRERIVLEEKQLLTQLFNELKLSPERHLADLLREDAPTFD